LVPSTVYTALYSDRKKKPVIVGVIGTISKSLRQYLSNIPEKDEIKKLQKNSHIGHAYIYRKC